MHGSMTYDSGVIARRACGEKGNLAFFSIGLFYHHASANDGNGILLLRLSATEDTMDSV